MGEKGWDAINALEVVPGKSVYTALTNAGKRVLKFPHPSGQNGEQVKLAKRQPFPSCEEFVTEQFAVYVERKRRKGQPMKRTPEQYKRKAGTIWESVAAVRSQFA